MRTLVSRCFCEKPKGIVKARGMPWINADNPVRGVGSPPACVRIKLLKRGSDLTVETSYQYLRGTRVRDTIHADRHGVFPRSEYFLYVVTSRSIDPVAV